MDFNTTLPLIKEHLQEGRLDEAVLLIEAMLPPDQAEIFHELGRDQQQALLVRLDAEQLADIFEELEDPAAARIAADLDVSQLAAIVDQMEPDEAADLLGDLEPAFLETALDRMETSEAVRPLLRYEDDTAGGLMTPEFIAYRDTDHAGYVLESIRKLDPEDLEIPYIFVIDAQRALVGVANLLELIRADPDQPMRDCMNQRVFSVSVNTDREEAARLMARYDLVALPVVDDHNRMLGIITIDDAVDVLEEETTEDLFDKAAIGNFGDSEMSRSYTMVRGPIWKVWSVRMPFLLITMVGGLLAGMVIGQFEEALKTITALAFFIPVVMDMGGNAGTQSSTIFTRALVLGHINPGRFVLHMLRESGIGLGMGVILGATAGIAAAIWQPDVPNIGYVVGLALALTITLATTLGFLIPFVLVKLGLDQTAGAVPVLTTIKDITGLSIYFALAYFLVGITA
jgi:magnesium transporter